MQTVHYRFGKESRRTEQSTFAQRLSGTQTWLGGHINPTMRVVIYHSIIVIPENVQWILDVLDDPTRQPEH
jgi:hypothetical protein